MWEISGFSNLMFSISPKNLYVNDQLVTEIVIPEGVTSIGNGAFYGCSSLTSITIPDSVTSIGGYAFYNCSSLTSINIPEGVTYIGSDTFYNCSSLTSINIPEGVTSIGWDAFYGCSGLTSITIPSSVTSIRGGAFSGCSSLQEITLPFVGENVGATSSDKVQYPLGYIFGTSSYTGSTAIEQRYKYTSINGYLNTSYYYFPTSLKKVTITGGNILYGAFYNCSSLTSITIPSSVTSIGEYAFYGCTGLTNITIPEDVTSIGSSAFYGCTGLTSITIPEGVTSIYSYTFKNCSRLKSITIPESVTSIGDSAFSGCTRLMDVINQSELQLTAGSTSYGYVAYYALVVGNGKSELVDVDGFVFCTADTGTNYLVDYRGSATDLVLPTNYNGQNYEIYEYTFYYKDDITSITIPESVRKIHQNAFGSMPNLAKVTFNAVYCADMSSSPFGSSGSKGFSVEFGTKVAKIPAYLFANCNVTDVTFADNCICTEIGKCAFDGCDDMMDFVIPDFVTTIGTYAFYNCSSLMRVTVGSSVASIGSGAFQNCKKLVEVINKSSLSIRASSGSSSYGYIGAYAIEVHNGNSKLINQNGYLFYPYGPGYLVGYIGEETELSLPADFNGYTTYAIWNYAFYNNDNITSVVIPKDVVSVGNYAFASCNNLESVTMGNGMASIQSYAFAYCYKLTSVIFGEGLPGYGLNIGSYAFYDCDGLVTIELPSTTKSIGSSAFYSCGKLEHITIGDNVTSIGSEVFKYCSALKSIVIGYDLTSIGSNAFDGCTNLKLVHIKSHKIVTALTSSTACGNLIYHAEVILAGNYGYNFSNFITAVFSYYEEFNYEGTDYISYSLHKHVWEDCSVERIPCEQAGFVGSKCTYCGLVKGNTSQAHAYAPHAANDAEYHWDVCDDCGATTNKIQHSWYSLGITTPATHISTGVMTYICNICVRTRTETIEKIAAHNYGQWIDIVQPECQTTGTLAHYHCECGLDFDAGKNIIEDLTIPARGHYVLQGGKELVDSYTIQNDKTYPFSLADGWYASSNRFDSTTSAFEIRATYDCTLVLKYKVSSENGYDKLIISQNSTTKDTISGSISEKTLTLTLKAGDVVYIKYSKDTSQSSGSDTGWFKIESCTQTEIDTTVYVPVEYVEPTCTDAVVCDSCKQTMKDALGHTEGEVVVENNVAPNCTEKGSYDNVVYCTVCNAELSRDTVVVDELGHTEGSVVVENNVVPDCVNNGSYDNVVYCTVCDAELSRNKVTVPATGHSAGSVVVENDVAPTCTVDGSYDNVTYCTVCETELSRATIVVTAPGHSFGEWTVSTAPTCTEAGEERRDCNNCDHYETRELAALGHDYSNGGSCALCGKLSDGAVTGIVAGSAVAVGGGGFSLFWFVIRKKRFNIKK